jgi:hypothetical protein
MKLYSTVSKVSLKFRLDCTQNGSSVFLIIFFFGSLFFSFKFTPLQRVSNFIYVSYKYDLRLSDCISYKERGKGGEGIENSARISDI